MKELNKIEDMKRELSNIYYQTIHDQDKEYMKNMADVINSMKKVIMCIKSDEIDKVVEDIIGGEEK